MEDLMGIGNKNMLVKQKQTNKQTEKIITKDPLIRYTNGLPSGAVQSCNHNHYQTEKINDFI